MMVSRKKILVFLFLTFVFSSVVYFPIISTGSMQNYLFFLMWCPGIAAILTQLYFERSLSGLGWRSGKFKYLLLGYGLPVCYGIVLYGFVWLTGLGRFSPGEMAEWVAVQWNIEVISPFLIIAIYILISATLGVLVSCLTALGEEIGWRGFLVPHLAKENSFTVTALLSGGIWAIWHFPGILFADYSDGRTPVWFVIIFFTVSALGISFPMAWLRLRSGSLWSPVLLHASHNLFLGSVFTPLTTETDITAYIVGEFGIGLALLLVLAAWVFWRRRGELPADVSATIETPSP